MKTPISRKIFFWSLFVSYFIITGIVLFFVFGYRHDFGQKVFVHTGSLTIKANPKNVSITLNGKEPKSRLVNVINDSYFITGLRPRLYNLSVTTDEFKTWAKDINIHSGISTEFWNILLLRQNYERTNFNISNIDKFFPAPAENIFAATRQMGKTFTVHIFDTKKDTSINTFIFPQTTFTQNEYENIEWSPTSKELIIPIIHTKENSTQKDYSINYLKTNQSYLLSDFIKYDNLRLVRWDPQEKNTLYFIYKDGLFRTELTFDEEQLKPVKIVNDVFAYDFADDGLYILNTSGEILYGGNKQGKDLKLMNSFDINQNHNDYRLIAYDNHRLIVIDNDSGDLFLYNKSDKNIHNKKLSTNITGAHFSDDGKKLLFHSPFEIFIYFTRDWNTQPVRNEDQMQSIIRFSQILENIHFAKDYEHIIYTAGNDVKITELDYRGTRITDTIISLDEEKSTLINKHKMNKLFFIDSTQNTNRLLQSIEFPEKETFF